MDKKQYRTWDWNAGSASLLILLVWKSNSLPKSIYTQGTLRRVFTIR